MLGQFLLAGLVLAVAACSPTPMRWERSGAACASKAVLSGTACLTT